MSESFSTMHAAPLTAPPFAVALAAAVDEVANDASLRRARKQLHRKALIIALWYVATYVWLLLAVGWVAGLLACVSMAFALAAVGFNIQHDANHNAFFDTNGAKRLTWKNRVVGWSMFAVGADANRWIYRHGTLHHSSPNVVGVDTDIALGPLARLAPAQRHYPWHRAQHYYLWVLYLFTAAEIMFSDIKALVLESLGRTSRRKKPGIVDYALALGTKLAAIVVLLGVPALFHPLGTVLLCATGVLLGAGFLLGIVFQSAHVVEEAEFSDAQERSGYRWHEWQVRSSLDFSEGDGLATRMFRWYAGGLDHQTEHHLFPHLPHTIYPAIAPAVTRVCTDYGIPRHVQPSFRRALVSHARHIKAMSRPAVTGRDAEGDSRRR